MNGTAESQLASTVLMIRPVRFESNPLTAASNRFQGRSEASAAEQQHAAQHEFDGLVTLLRDNGVEAIVVDDTVDLELLGSLELRSRRAGGSPESRVIPCGRSSEAYATTACVQRPPAGCSQV